ncbi:MAG: hypothetical protein LUE98_13575 [Tannerellaceae bacterium]|nr:hypothetical protein [Tannerellaceae bacterium]
MYRKESFTRFIEAIKQRIPERGKQTAVIGQILNMEKESVYRRLRGDVPFIFSEIVTLSRELGISIDSLIPESDDKSRPFQLKMVDYIDFNEEDLKLLEDFLRGLELVVHYKDSGVGGALNILPQSLCMGYKHLYKFYLFKWRYQYGGSELTKHYKEVELPERLKKINEKIQAASRNAAYTYLIWDTNLFSNLVNDIKYFASINLITPQEIECLKAELAIFANDMELLAINGCHKNGNKINFYVSNVTFETSYSYIEAGDFHLTMLKSFTLNDATSMDEKIFQQMKKWLQSLKRTSTLISESGQMQRIRFFDKQRKVIDTL